MARARTPGGRVALRATLDLEGLTMPRGELDPGAWGEGFNDRRHPHTYAHELMLELTDLLGTLGGLHVSLSAGKGFAPFGTPDPMHRPPLRYPVNHHWSQVLERAVAVLGVRAGMVTGEAGLMNGDEPERPGQRSERPEEQRTPNPFRSIRPHLDNSILGTARRSGPGVADPKQLYGRNELWSASVGLRMRTDGPFHTDGPVRRARARAAHGDARTPVTPP